MLSLISSLATRKRSCCSSASCTPASPPTPSNSESEGEGDAAARVRRRISAASACPAFKLRAAAGVWMLLHANTWRGPHGTGLLPGGARDHESDLGCMVSALAVVATISLQDLMYSKLASFKIRQRSAPGHLLRFACSDCALPQAVARWMTVPRLEHPTRMAAEASCMGAGKPVALFLLCALHTCVNTNNVSVLSSEHAK